MAIVSIGGLLNRIRRFDTQLAQYYAAIRDKTPDNDVKLLTYCLCRHRRNLDATLKEFQSQGLARARSARLRADTAFRLEDAFGPLDVPPARIKGRELLRAAVNYQTALMDLYRCARAQRVNREARALLARLVQSEKRDLAILQELQVSHYF